MMWLGKNFFPYIIHYPKDYEDGYDGIHDGGIKGIKKSAPDDMKQEFKEYIEVVKENKYFDWDTLEYREIDD